MKHFLTTAIVATVAALPFSPEGVAQNADNTPVEIYASVYHANSWVEHSLEEVGIYRFGADSYSPSLVMQDPYLDASGGGAMTDDFYFCTAEINYGTWTEITHYGFDPDTWTERMRLTDGSPKAIAMDMTYDPQTAKIYGCFNNDNGDGYVFGTLDIATGDRFRIADLDTPWLACSVDKNGNLYAITMDGELLKIDKVYGTTTSVADLNISGSIRSTGAIDPRTNIFYFVISSQQSEPDATLGYKRSFSDLWSVDLNEATPVATHRYSFADGEVMGGMWIPGAIAADDAPAAATGLTVNFPEGALSGTVGFSIPDTTFGGAPLSGEVSYLIRANGALMAEGKAMAGTEVNVPAKVDAAAMYDIELTLANSSGRSPKSKLTMWLGPDTPKPVTDVKLTYADGHFILTWTAPEESEHGGYFNPEAITYSVTRNPDGVTTNNLTETTFTDEVEMTPQLTIYSYDVVMTYNGKSRPAVTSNVWRLGAMALPWSTDFESEDALNLFTIIDVNGDRAEWYREWEWWIDETEELVAAVAYPYSSTKAADDWLITPPFKFEKGNSYTLSFEAMVMSDSDPERLAVSLGNAPEVEAMSNRLLEPFELTNMTPRLHTTDITVDKTGVYYIGFHACSDPFMSGLALKSISVSAPVSGMQTTVTETEAAITVSGGVITISAATVVDYSIYTIDGCVVMSGSASDATISVPSGIYIVKAGATISKITF